MIELTFQKELMLKRQTNQRVQYFSLLDFLNKGFKCQSYVCNRCHNLLMMSMNLSILLF